MKEKVKLGMSVGDINGIGPEVILKSMRRQDIMKKIIPVVYGSIKVISYHKNIVGDDFQFFATRNGEKLDNDKINVVNCWQDNVNITLGKETDQSGKCAVMSLDAAVSDLQAGFIDALVTAPINKHAMKLANFPYPGHTEYLTEKFGVEESLMMMVSDWLKVGLVTNHLPLSKVASSVTKEKIIRKAQIFSESLKNDFGIERPVIAVLGLNPHAGDEGAIGNEEEKIIRPAIIELKKSGVMAVGPFPADGFFGSDQLKKFHGILAMYHDQGLTPFKALSFGSGVNFTAGLPFIRTSPDHGTAYDLAGKNEADPSSFIEAIHLSIELAIMRREFNELKKNALVRKEKPMEEGEEEEVLLED